MKRMHLLLFLPALFFQVSIQAGDKLAAIIELPAATEPFMGIDGSYYNQRITIESQGLETTTRTNQCFSTSGVAQPMHALLFGGDPKHANGNYSHITIRNTGSEQLTRIELVASSSHNSSAAYLLLDASSMVDASQDADYDNLLYSSPLDNYMLPVLMGNNALCPTVQSTDLREMWELWFGLTGEIKTLRLRFSDGTGDFSSSQYEYRPTLQALYIYVEDNGLGTSTGNLGQEGFTFSYTKETVVLSQPADITVFDITGKVSRQASWATTLSLRDVPCGIYIIKATDSKGNSITRKVVR
ncbi:MAG: T9SS type A sorting domain-containing protein [Candidatus Azobacteroides sp.]|nr:T9SS type A sorting domain-containing protein [Candidatus Azobacteroides sp.]